MISRIGDMMSRISDMMSRIGDVMSRISDMMSRISDMMSCIGDMMSRIGDMMSHIGDYNYGQDVLPRLCLCSLCITSCVKCLNPTILDKFSCLLFRSLFFISFLKMLLLM